MYTITIENPHKPTETATRKRRDAACLFFERAVYAALKGHALLDRPVAVRAMERAVEAYDNGLDAVSVGVCETVIRFRAA